MTIYLQVGQQRPLQANTSSRSLRQVNTGSQRPTTANAGPQKPTKSNAAKYQQEARDVSRHVSSRYVFSMFDSRAPATPFRHPQVPKCAYDCSYARFLCFLFLISHFFFYSTRDACTIACISYFLIYFHLVLYILS